MDGPFWVDSRSPHQSADYAAVTVISTYKALVPVAGLPILGSNYFGWVGKAVRMRIFGRWSTAATPGTQTFSLLWGNGTDANGAATPLASSQVITPIASLVNTSFRWEMIIRCRAVGASGSLICNGSFSFLNSLTLTTAINEFLIPATADAAVTADTTANNVISPQTLATTSTTNTMTVHDFLFEALN